MRDLRQQAELLFNEINNKLGEAEQLDKKEALLEEQGRQIGKKQEQLVKDQAKLDSERANMTHEKEFIAKALQKVKENETLEKRIDEKRELIKKEMGELVVKRVENEAEMKLKNDKIKEYDGLKKKEEELALKEELLKKKEQLQDARGKDLDIQDKANKSEASRLQVIAERFA